jgi:hypothetical protein
VIDLAQIVIRLGPLDATIGRDAVGALHDDRKDVLTPIIASGCNLKLPAVCRHAT